MQQFLVAVLLMSALLSAHPAEALPLAMDGSHGLFEPTTSTTLDPAN